MSDKNRKIAVWLLIAAFIIPLVLSFIGVFMNIFVPVY